jgi:hypothetical protein
MGEDLLHALTNNATGDEDEEQAITEPMEIWINGQSGNSSSS